MNTEQTHTAAIRVEWTHREGTSIEDHKGWHCILPSGQTIVFGDGQKGKEFAEQFASAPELLKENEQLKKSIENGKRELGTKIFDLKALNAELLEALKEMLEETGEQWDDEEEPETSEAAKSRNKMVRAYKKSKALIAKAEGKS